MTRAPVPDSPAIRRIGEDGLLVEFAPVLSETANAAALAFRAAVDAAGWSGLRETATALKSTYVRFDPLEVPHATMEARLAALAGTRDWTAAPLPRGRRRWRIPAAFGGAFGPQLAEVATATELTEAAAVAELVAAPLRVLAMGFAPGMPYLGILPPQWDIPRQTALTPAVPPGALVVAVRQVVAFTVPAQTGWRQVGRAAFRAFDPGAEHPFLLTPGDEVSFEVVSPEVLHRHLDGDMARPEFEVIA